MTDSTTPITDAPAVAKTRNRASGRPRRAWHRPDTAAATERAEAGYVLIEFLFWAPFLLLIVLPFAVLAGRIVHAESLANGVAADAARAASLQRTDATARSAATRAAELSLDNAGISCRHFDVTLTGSIQPGGVITVTVACTMSLADLAMPGVPGSKTLTATASDPIENTRTISLGFSSTGPSARNGEPS